MKGFVSILFTVFMATVMPMDVSAQEQFEINSGGFYVVLDGGSRGVYDESEVDVTQRIAVEAEYDPGYIFGGGFGYDTGEGWRYEIAVSYSENEAGVIGFGEVRNPSGMSLGNADIRFDDSYASTFNVLATGFYDIHLRQYKNFVPYIGLGFGYGRVKVKGDATVSLAGETVTVSISGRENQFVSASMLGFRYSLSDNLSVGLESSSLAYDVENPSFVYDLKARVYYSF